MQADAGFARCCSVWYAGTRAPTRTYAFYFLRTPASLHCSGLVLSLGRRRGGEAECRALSKRQYIDSRGDASSVHQGPVTQGRLEETPTTRMGWRGWFEGRVWRKAPQARLRLEKWRPQLWVVLPRLLMLYLWSLALTVKVNLLTGRASTPDAFRSTSLFAELFERTSYFELALAHPGKVLPSCLT